MSDDTEEALRGSRKRKRTFPCQFCVREFTRNEHLQRHERLHTKEKPFRCTTCSASFTRRDLLSRHISLLHPLTIVEPHDHITNSSIHEEASQPDVGHTDMPGDTQITSIHDIEALREDHDTSSTNPISSSTRLTPSVHPDIFDAPGASLDSTAVVSVTSPHEPSQIPWTEQTTNFDDFSSFIDSMSLPSANDLSSMYIHQPFLPFSPDPLFSTVEPQSLRVQPQDSNVSRADPNTTSPSTSRLFDEFSTTFPSFESSSSPAVRSEWEPWKLTQANWDHLQAEVRILSPALADGFSLPSRHTLCRYIATYVTGCQRHLPFLHIPTFSPTKWPVEQILAMASIGAQYSFDGDNAVRLFRVSLAITMERLHNRKTQLQKSSFQSQDGSPIRSHYPSLSFLGPSPLSQEAFRSSALNPVIMQDSYDALPLAQTLLLLLVMATWANSKAIFNEAPDLRGTLSNFLREEKLLSQISDDETWLQWVHSEALRRTVGLTFCFLNLHTIVYDTPPSILNSELNICLPSREALWEARNEAAWMEARGQVSSQLDFKLCYSLLFSKEFEEKHQPYSALGGYMLMLALIQQIYFLRETNKCKLASDGSLSPADVADIELALRNWQYGWNKDPESSFNPGSPQGPISFNSTALLRMAFIRLNVNTGPWRALQSQDPYVVARSISQSPHLERGHKITRVVLYCAHALSIPVKIGINVVARSQAFAWPPGHSLCALECAIILSKWLIAVQSCTTDAPLDEEEARLLAYITDMVAEADPEFIPASNGQVRMYQPDLSVRVVGIWARLMGDGAVWDIVRLVGRVLETYSRNLAQDIAT